MSYVPNRIDGNCTHEDLETLAETWALSVSLGQRRHDLRVANDERWVDALRFDEFAYELIDESGICSWFRAINVVLDAEIRQELLCCGIGKLFSRWELDVELVL